MADINPSLPVAGQPNSSEEPKIITALSQIIATINNLDTANLADGAVTAAKIEAQQAWQSVLFSIGTYRCFKDSVGIVRFRGDALVTGALSAGSAIGTLAPGYRPGVTMVCLLVRGDSSAFPPVRVQITTAGVVAVLDALGGSPATYSFIDVTYRAEN